MSYRYRVRLYHLGRFVQEVEWPAFSGIDLKDEIDWLKELHKALQHSMALPIDYDCLQSPFSGAKYYTTPWGLLANGVVNRNGQLA